MSDCERIWNFSTRLYGAQMDFVRKRAKSYGSVSKYIRYLVRQDMEKKEAESR